MASGESTSNTQDATPFYRWFLILFSLFVVVMSIINSVYYNNVLNQYTAQPDVQQDVGKGWARAMYGINIALAVIGSLVLVFQLLKVIMGKNEFDLWERIKKFFKPEKTASEIATDAAKEAGTTPDIAAAAGSAAASEGADAPTSVKTEAGEKAAMAAGADKTTAAKVAAYIAGSPKRIAAFVKAKFAKKEPGYCGAPIAVSENERKNNKTKIDLIKKYEDVLQIDCNDDYSINNPLFDTYFAAASLAANDKLGEARGLIYDVKNGAKFKVNNIKETELGFCNQPMVVNTASELVIANECVDSIKRNLTERRVINECIVGDFGKACASAKQADNNYKSKSS